MKKSLYQINEDFLELIEQLEENEGELTPELEQSLEIAANEFEEKSENYIKAIKNIDNDVLIIKNEIARLNELKKRKEKTSNRLKDFLQYSMRLRGVRKIDTGLFMVSLRKSKYVEIIQPEELPEDFLVKKITVAPDKKKLKEVLSKGGEIPGAVLKERENLQIK